MMGYVVKITNEIILEKMQEGRFAMWGGGGMDNQMRPLITSDKFLALKFPDEESAERFIQQAGDVCGIDLEEFVVEAVAWDRNVEFRLSDDEFAPCLAVNEDEKDNSLYLFVTEGGGRS